MIGTPDARTSRLESRDTASRANPAATWKFALEIERQRTRYAWSQLEQLERELDSSRRDHQVSLEDLADAKQALDRAQDLQQSLQDELEACQSEYERQAAELDEVKSAWTRDAALVHQHEQSIDEQERTIVALGTQQEELDKRIRESAASHTQNLSERDARIAAQLDALAERDQQLKEAESELQRLRSELEERTEQSATKLAEQQRIFEELAFCNEMLETRFLALEKKAALAQAVSAQSESSLKEQAGNLRASLDAECQARKRERSAFVVQQQRLESKVRDLQRELADARRAAVELDQRLHACQKEAARCALDIPRCDDSERPMEPIPVVSTSPQPITAIRDSNAGVEKPQDVVGDRVITAVAEPPQPPAYAAGSLEEVGASSNDVQLDHQRGGAPPCEETWEGTVPISTPALEAAQTDDESDGWADAFEPMSDDWTQTPPPRPVASSRRRTSRQRPTRRGR